MGRSYFHLHLVSDATGETLIAVSRAAAAQYQGISAIEHVYPLVRTATQLDRAISELEPRRGWCSTRWWSPSWRSAWNRPAWNMAVPACPCWTRC